MVDIPKLISKYEQMAGDRAAWESVWREINAVCYPTGPRLDDLDFRGARTTDDMYPEPKSARRARRMYDTTGAIALDRVTSGIESLITPQGQQWHELGLENAEGIQPDLETEAWLERITEYLFKIRYDPRSGWLLSHQRALSSTLALGTGVYFADEGFGTRDRTEAQLPVRYIPIPLSEAYLGINDFGEHDTCLRCYSYSATQAVQKFGNSCHPDVIANSQTPGKQETKNSYLHVVMPSQFLPGGGGYKRFPFSSIYLDMDHMILVREGGFFEFPYIVYTWTLPTTTAYGESPAMIALPDMKSLQLMSRDALLASQVNIRPPVATAFELDRPVNLNPGAINPKMVDPNSGRPLIQPVLPPTDPRFFEATMELRRAQIRQALFVDLFNILENKPNMSATEAMIRNQEKGELLGPAASRIQVGLSRLVDRELSILERKGAFRPDSFLAPPETIRGQNIGPKFISPIDRARQMPEVTGMTNALMFAGQLAQFEPTVMDNFDADAMARRARYLLGAPAISQRDPEEVENMREERARANAMREAAMAANQTMDTMSKMGPAAEGATAMAQTMQNAGIDPRMVAGIPQLR